MLDASEAGEWPSSLVVRPWLGRLEVSFASVKYEGLMSSLTGILAFALGKMDGVGGRRGWAWSARFTSSYDIRLTTHHRCRIFIIEGILTIVVSLVSYFIVPTWSYKAKFVWHHHLFFRIDLTSLT